MSDWFGDLPTGWTIAPLGNYFTERREVGSADDFPALSVTKDGVVEQLADVAKSAYTEQRRVVREGDFAINSRSDRKGSAGIVPRDGSVSVITTVLQPRQIDGVFAHYLLRSEPFQEEFYRYGSGIVADLWSTRWSAMKAIKLALPNMPAQRAIAASLDRETAEIDAFIADQEQLIALLEERRQATVDAEIEPKAEAAATTFGRIGTTFYGIAEPPPYHETGTPLIRATNVSRGRITPRGMAYVDPADVPASRGINLRVGDIIVVRSGALTGDSAIITEDWSCALAGFDMVWRAGSRILPNYAQYALLSSQILGDQIGKLRMRAAQPHLNAEELASIRVWLPSRAEQAAIVARLDAETAFIDAAIADAREAVLLSKERRAALISAAVTGRIDMMMERKRVPL